MTSYNRLKGGAASLRPSRRYCIGLAAMAVAALLAALTTPVAPMFGIACMIVMAGLGLALLVGDKPRGYNGLPVPSGATAMQMLYAEIEGEMALGRVYPFGNWSPRHKEFYDSCDVIGGIHLRPL